MLGVAVPGNLHLINGLYDCQRSRVPVLAIAAQIPSAELGSSYFPSVLSMYSHGAAITVNWCRTSIRIPRVLEITVQTAISKRGVSVIAIPGDIAMKEAVTDHPRVHYHEPSPNVCPSEQELNTLANLLNRSKKITIFGGAGCAGAHARVSS